MQLRRCRSGMVLAWLVAGMAVGVGVSPALAGGDSGARPKEKTVQGAAAAAARAKAEAARRQKMEQRCTRANKGLNAAVESAAKAMRGALRDFHLSTDDEATTLTDDEINGLGLIAQGKLADALAAGKAAVAAAHDAALADLTAQGAPQAMLDRLERQTTCATNRLAKLSDCAAHKLAEMLAEALGENDEPADPTTPDDSGGSGDPTT